LFLFAFQTVASHANIGNENFYLKFEDLKMQEAFAISWPQDGQ
jgi:hypothetical protein